MHAAIQNVENLLSGSCIYQIPHFQRAYSWGDKQWKRLWSDILTIAAEPGTRSHFLGPLVCSAPPPMPGRHIGMFEVIDGQQRLTTISILLGAMRDHALSSGCADVANDITQRFLIHGRSLGMERYKLIPRIRDRRTWQSLVDHSGSGEIDVAGRSRIDEAWDWALGVVDNLPSPAEGESIPGPQANEPTFESILHAIAHRLSFVSISISDDDPYRVFESLNTTGLALTEFDLVRNYLFMRIPLEDQERFEAQEWAPFERLFDDVDAEDRRREKVATTFVRHFLMTEFGYFKKGQTYQYFLKWSELNRSNSRMSPSEILQRLTCFAQNARSLRDVDRMREGRGRGDSGIEWPTDETTAAMLRLAYCDAGSTSPLVYKMFALRDEGQITEIEVRKILRDLTGFLVRRALCGDSTRSYNRRFANYARDFDPPYVSRLREALHDIGWPGDDRCMEACRTFPVYTKERRKARLILEENERDLGGKEPVQLARLQIEHVLPQSITGHGAREWMEMLGDSWDTEHTRLVHTIGNLSLTGWNAELSNGPFSAKRPDYLTSPIRITAGVADQEVWNGVSIEARSDELTIRFLSLFPRHGEPKTTAGTQARQAGRAAWRRQFWGMVQDATDWEKTFPFPRKTPSRAYLIARSRFKGVAFMPWIEDRNNTFGVWVKFDGEAGRQVYDGMATRREVIDGELDATPTLGFTNSGQPRLEYGPRAADLSLDNDGASAAAEVAGYTLELERAMHPLLQEIAEERIIRVQDASFLRSRWNEALLRVTTEHTASHRDCAPGGNRKIIAGGGVWGAFYVYTTNKRSSRVGIHFRRRNPEDLRHLELYDHVFQSIDQIETSTGLLERRRDPTASVAKLWIEFEGGYGSPEHDWPSLHSRMAEAMKRLQEVIDPVLAEDAI